MTDHHDHHDHHEPDDRPEPSATPDAANEPTTPTPTRMDRTMFSPDTLRTLEALGFPIEPAGRDRDPVDDHDRVDDRDADGPVA